MIKANELRIGNILNYTGKGNAAYPSGIVAVNEVLSDGINLSMGDSTVYEFELLQPIPLTPEILEKVGFEKDHNTSFFKYPLPLSIAKLSVNPDNGTVWLRKNGNSLNPIDVKYVHQLQNLYFTLSGEELEVNL
jgi:hypothetical protein